MNTSQVMSLMGRVLVTQVRQNQAAQRVIRAQAAFSTDTANTEVGVHQRHEHGRHYDTEMALAQRQQYSNELQAAVAEWSELQEELTKLTEQLAHELGLYAEVAMGDRPDARALGAADRLHR